MSRPNSQSTTVPAVFRGLSLIGGHPAFDFLNTVKYRGQNDPQDKLSSFSDVIAWARVAGLLSAAEARQLTVDSGRKIDTARLLRSICAFREQTRILFDDSKTKPASYARAASAVEMQISKLRPAAHIDRRSGELSQGIPIRSRNDLKARIVASVADILTEKGKLRIGNCSGSDCDWMYVDRTKAGRRQWCDSRTCGNIERVRRFRIRNTQ